MTPAPDGPSTGDTDASSAPGPPTSAQKHLPPTIVDEAAPASPTQVDSAFTQLDTPDGTTFGDADSSAAAAEVADVLSNGISDVESHANGTSSAGGPNGWHLELEPNGKSEPYGQAKSNHVIRLSGIEHCMPRSYIRLCLAYPLPNKDMLPEVEARLNDFVQKTVDAKPYLSGSVVAVDNPGNQVGAVEIRFSDTDFLQYPKVRVRHFAPEEVDHLSYEQLCEKSLPPSLIKPEIVSVLKESADESWAPVFRIQANVIDGGVIISVYLHHCISDGTGAGLLVSGSLLQDEFKFDRHLDGGEHDTPTLSHRLEAFAERETHVRNELSLASFNQINNRQLKWKKVPPPGYVDHTAKPLGRGCVFRLPLDKLEGLKLRLETHAGSGCFMSRNDVLMALVWHSMTKARVPSLDESKGITASRLNIPVDIRKKLKKPLSISYFGAAVDFASTEMPLCHLTDICDANMAQTALAVRKAVNSVDEAYIRQAIALATKSSPDIDVRDLQGSNMDRAEGADMYITSWEKLPLYEATFDMGLGQPDWVRKPWSRDPGSCIVLPFDKRKDYLEVVIQMATPDMGRLLEDTAFWEYVSTWIE
jgi:trichothecene 3-O-acetyltransferase